MSRNIFLIENKANDTVDITIEGYIGDRYDDNKESILTKEDMAKQLKQVAEIKAKYINVYINSYGGDVNHGVSIHDLLANHPASVTTIINGHTASSATIIAMAADKGQRRISANSLALIHRASTFAIGNVNDMEASLSDLKKVDDTIANIYAKRCEKTMDEVMEQMNKFNGIGEWFTASEAKEWGLVDEVYEPTRMAAVIDEKVFDTYGLPAIPQEKLNIINSIEPKPKTENTMKKFALMTMAFLATFFGKKQEDEIEITQDDLQKLNDELQRKTDDIVKLTSDTEAAVQNLNAEKESLAAAQKDLEAAHARIKELEAQLKAPGEESAAAISSKESAPAAEDKPKIAANSDDFLANLDAVKKAYL
jgi:ATP-dependent Clp endopeptidase proteolytic subunit ClpP